MCLKSNEGFKFWCGLVDLFHLAVPRCVTLTVQVIVVTSSFLLLSVSSILCNLYIPFPSGTGAVGNSISSSSFRSNLFCCGKKYDEIVCYGRGQEPRGMVKVGPPRLWWLFRELRHPIPFPSPLPRTLITTNKVRASVYSLCPGKKLFACVKD